MNKILQGDCLEVLKTLKENSIDSIVTDPPYELGFMAKSWDNTGIAYNAELWKQCLRVLKPGGHLLAFSGTRTYHRMAVAIEDAGFEVRDMIEWVYGSGFPKSLNIGKAVDKLGGRGLGQEIVNIIKQKRIELGYSTIKLAEIGGFYGNTNHGGTVSNWETGNGSITPEQFNKLIDILGLENEPVIANERELLGKSKFGASSIYGSEIYNNRENGKEIDITKGTSKWEGWGTALKPAHEPICMARKPLAEKTVAENCLKWKCGGLNIDVSRVEFEDTPNPATNPLYRYKNDYKQVTDNGQHEGVNVKFTNSLNPPSELGRFPANLIHDNSEEVRECFPETNASKSAKRGIQQKGYSAGIEWVEGREETNNVRGYDDNGGNASRFFKSILYYPKASKSERNKGCEELEEKPLAFSNQEKAELKKGNKNFDGAGSKGHGNQIRQLQNNHPTVKPIALMEYLIKMVTFEGGVVLDPFAGSGTTLIAAKKNGYQYIGIEKEIEYIEIINARLDDAQLNIFEL